MSYDVSIGDFESNMTRNIANVIYDHLPDYGNGGGLREIDGKTGNEALFLLSDMFDRLSDSRQKYWSTNQVGEPEFCAKYDAKNGWGSLVAALIWLAQIMAACAKNRKKIVRVSS